MITICVVLAAACIIAMLALVLGGAIAILWPLLLILAIGLIIDILVFKALFKKSKKED